MSILPALPASPLGNSPSVGTDTSRLATTDNLKAAGQKFESVFTGMMLKAMRSTHLSEDLFGSKAQDQFRDIWDQKTVEAMATHTPLGIGKAMTDFLSRNQPGLAPTGDTAPAASAGAPNAAIQSVVNSDRSQTAL